MVPVPVRVEHLPAVTRAQSRVQATAARSVLKVVRCPFSVVSPNSASSPIQRTEYKAINLSDLETLAASANLDKITPAELIAAGIVNGKQPVKILANGTLTKKLEVVANAFSATAEKAITELGGTVTKI